MMGHTLTQMTSHCIIFIVQIRDNEGITNQEKAYFGVPSELSSLQTKNQEVSGELHCISSESNAIFVQRCPKKSICSYSAVFSSRIKVKEEEKAFLTSKFSEEPNSPFLACVSMVTGWRVSKIGAWNY